MNVANKSGVDDTTIGDWRRMPADDGFCVCTPAPVGLPDFMGSFGNSTYLGRVKFMPQYQTVGVGGPPNGKYVVADAYVKWNFHLFVSVDTFLPAMFSSPYGGMSTYGNWSIPPDYLWPESVAGGWRKDPPHCVNVADDKTCEPYV